MASIIGTKGNDTLYGNGYDNILTGGGGNDIYDSSYSRYTITDFGGIGKGVNPSAAVIAEVDTLTFSDYGLTAENLLLTQNGNNLEITFEEPNSFKVILQNFALENLDNLSKSTGATVDLGNILFYGQTSITDSFDVFNANSTRSTIFNKNTVTFLNDLNNNVSGFDNSDDVINGQGGDDIIDGLSGNDILRGGEGNNLLNGGDGNDSLFISTDYDYYPSSGNNTLNGDAGNDTLDTGHYLTGNNLLNGGDGNDSLKTFGAGDDTLNGGNGDDTLRGGIDDDTLTGGAGNDKFVYNTNYEDDDDQDTHTITDFGGAGKGSNPSEAVIASLDTLEFTDSDFTAQNLQLTQNGNNLEITFERFDSPKVILQNFALENLDNLSKSTGATVDLGNILFSGQTTITDSFDVFNANSTQSSIFNKNTVTFLNDLDNNVNGFDNSDDVINGQGGDDKIDGKSGNDMLRGGAGDDTLVGGALNDTLSGDIGNNSLVGGTGDDYLNAYYSTGNNTLSGGAGDDTFDAEASFGNNLLSGGDGNDSLSTSYSTINYGYGLITSSGNNTLNGGAGDDTLNAESPFGNNLLCGGDGNDFLSSSGYDAYRSYFSFSSSGNNTLNGSAGDDTLRAEYSTGDNLLSGGDGNDYLSISGYVIQYNDFEVHDYSSGNNTLNGGAGDDTLRAEYSTGNNLLSGGDGNDSLYLSATPADTAPSYLMTQTVDGGKGDDLLSVDYTLATGGITTTINATTNIGSITAGTNSVSYKNIERLNISGTAYDDNIVGNNGNDTLSTGYGGNDTIDAGKGDDYLSTVIFYGQTSTTVNNDTIDGGKGDDLLSVDASYSTEGITATFNATTNIGEITTGKNRVSYSNIEELNILGTYYDDNIVGSNGNDTLSTGVGGNDTINGAKGDDLLVVNSYYTSTEGITTTFNATTNIGEITSGKNRVSYKNIERLNIPGTSDNDLIVGNDGNDTLSGNDAGNDTLIGGAGNDILTGSGAGNDILTGGAGNDILTGGGGNDIDILTGGAGNDKFVYMNNENTSSSNQTDTITDFVGVGKGSDPSAEVIASSDTLQFTGRYFTAQNLQLTQNGNNLEITFEDDSDNKVTLQNFKLENLDNLAATSSRPAIGNILFDGQTNITDSFDVFDGNSTQTSLFNKNTVTFLNDLDNNIIGFDNSNDVINGQGGDDIIHGLGGNDFLRGGTGNNTLNGGAGDDSLSANGSTGDNLLSGGDDNDYISASSYFFSLSPVMISSGNDTLDGGAGDDSLSANGSTGDNLLSGGDGNDTLSASFTNFSAYSFSGKSLGNNTLKGGAGDDYLDANAYSFSGKSLGNNTLKGGAGDDYLDANGSKGNNILFGDDGNDTLSASSYGNDPSGNNIFYGGNGNDILIGGFGNDTLYGGDGNDTLYVGFANDTLYGGDGNDTFAFNSYNEGIHAIYDFNATNDLIQVSVFSVDLLRPSLLASQFTIGTSATTSEERFIYNSATGALFFDQDGSASGFTQVKFAQLSAGLSLTENNFVVV